MDRIDLRSDTVTWPTPAMREAMAWAVVGDDVYGEDPTVNRLEAVAAEIFGKEAALFLSSGSMANLVAVLAHCDRGDEMILGDKAHTFCYEAGGASAFGGVHPHTIPVQPDGTLALDAIRAAIRDPEDFHAPPTRLIALENAQCGVGGVPITPEYLTQVAALAADHKLRTHVDGARIFNAAAALNCDVRRLADPVDSITCCLSKGLCAPVGSLLMGDQAFIHRARRMRKALGGGMRQAGILAAAGLIALQEMAQRVHEDHQTARQLAEGLAALPGIIAAPEHVHINMVFFALDDVVPLTAFDVARQLEKHHILIGARDERRFRSVTHYWIRPEHIEEVLGRLRDILS